ncbi:MAG: class I SAM-dependent methyltransferase [Candidatus Odinarchaeia archaeon]
MKYKLDRLIYAFRHPYEAVAYLLFRDKYDFIKAEKEFIKAERKKRNIEPLNPLEIHMLKPTDICDHLVTLYMLSVQKRLKIMVELGTRGGESTIALLEAAKQIDGHVYSIDVDQCLEAKETIKNYDLQKYWTFIQVDDLKIKWEKSIDHLFIDTIHTYDQTLSELIKYEPYVNHGGVITLHDIISCPDVLEAINTYIKDKPNLCLYKYFNCNGLAIIFKS